jgi:hypothetical protein
MAAIATATVVYDQEEREAMAKGAEFGRLITGR